VRYLLEIGRAAVELPEVIRPLSLKADGNRSPADPGLVVTPLPEISIGHRLRQGVRRKAGKPIGRFGTKVFQQMDCPPGRKVMPLLVGRAQFERGDNFAPAF
jgi:hypothetical protein